jgi:signal transduction histidine kinase
MVETSPNVSDEVKQQVDRIRSRMWLVLLAIVIPFALLALAIILQADSTADKMLVAAVSVLTAGIAVIAAKITLHTVTERYLQAIENLSDAKSDFISIAAHQLKSPVSALQFTIDTLVDRVTIEDSEAQNLLTDLETSVNRLDSLTHSLLNVTRIEADSFAAEPETLDLQKEITKTIKELRPIAENRGITTQTDLCAKDCVEAHIDPELLYGVMENLLTNAYEHAPQGSAVTVRTIENSETYVVQVENKVTESISQADLDRLFQKFERGNDGQETSTGGGGIGLYIARLYVNQWGGSIEATMKTDNTVEFAFTVPLDR